MIFQVLSSPKYWYIFSLITPRSRLPTILATLHDYDLLWVWKKTNAISSMIKFFCVKITHFSQKLQYSFAKITELWIYFFLSQALSTSCTQKQRCYLEWFMESSLQQMFDKTKRWNGETFCMSQNMYVGINDLI